MESWKFVNVYLWFIVDKLLVLVRYIIFYIIVYVKCEFLRFVGCLLFIRDMFLRKSLDKVIVLEIDMVLEGC